MNVYVRLSESEKSSLNKAFPGLDVSKLDINRLWNLMDQIWDDLGCNYSTSEDNLKKIEKFYEHPVWILNGLFVEKDSESQTNREKIVNWINDNYKEYLIKSVLDYGGGFGTLARMISSGIDGIDVKIMEPHPPTLAQRLNKNYKNISYVSKLKSQFVDCIVCTDVLEHLFDPLSSLREMREALRDGGVLIIGSCFYPYIKCHLPGNFYLRYFFKYFAVLIGFKLIHSVSGGYLFVFAKKNGVTPNFVIQIFMVISRMLYPFLNFIQKIK
jgi:2-polyprenyl-6-hydroxyphenyl methylase/3-demethylubiquinone-9 3-methyltransferase